MDANERESRLQDALASYYQSYAKRMESNPVKWTPILDASEVQAGGKVLLFNAEGKLLEGYWTSYDPNAPCKSSLQQSSFAAISTKKSSPRRQMSDLDIALDWARSQHYSIPASANRCLDALMLVLGFSLGIVPGILYAVYISGRQREYKRRLTELSDKWIDAGRPHSGDS